MLHWIYPPSNEFSEFIECYWFIEKTSNSDDNFPKLNPDTSAHLILSPSAASYSYSFEQNVMLGMGSHLLSPHQKTLDLDHSQPFTHLGIKFRTGALYSMPIDVDRKVVLDVIDEVALLALIGIDEEALNCIFALARQEAQSCIAALEHYLFSWIELVNDDSHSKLTKKIIEALEHTTISDLAKRLHCSQRTIERSFIRVTGLTLKQHQAITKLELLLEYLYQKEHSQVDWVDIAFEFGFSDQPHLIRYLKHQIGTTPKKYVSKRGFTIDIYGGVSSS